MANVGVQRVFRLLVFTETQLSARFLHFVIIFCQKMAVFPCNVREARLSACHLGRIILARFLFMLFLEHSVLRYAAKSLWCSLFMVYAVPRYEFFGNLGTKKPLKYVIYFKGFYLFTLLFYIFILAISPVWYSKEDYWNNY